MRRHSLRPDDHKTVISNLFLQGTVLIGGRDVSSMTTDELAKRISFVQQEPAMFPMSIAENIAYGLPKKGPDAWSMDGVVKAAKTANAHNFIMSLPDGYDTWVGEGGRSLSGGQKQR